MATEEYKVKLEGDSSGLDGALGRANKSFGKLKVSMKDLKIIGAASLAAITGAATVSINAFAKFDNELRGVKTLLDKNSFGAKGLEKGFKDLTDGVKALGAKAPVDIGAMNKALFDTISAGVDASEAVKVLETSAKLAVAGLTDVSTATDGMTSALNAYSLGAEDAEEVASKFFAAQKAGKTTIAELSSGFGLVGASASAAGVSLDELLAATSAVTTAGVATSAAYTGLKAVLGNIAKPTADAAVEANRLGIEFNSAALRSKGLKGFMDELTSSQNFNADSLSKLFGSLEAHKVATSLAGSQSKAFADTLETLADKQGAVNTLTDAYKTQSGSLQNQLTATENKIKLLAITLGEKLAPQLELITKYWGNLAGDLAEWVQSKDGVEELNAEIAKLEERLQKAKDVGFFQNVLDLTTIGDAGEKQLLRVLEIEKKLLKAKEERANLEVAAIDTSAAEAEAEAMIKQVEDVEAAKTQVLLDAKADRAAKLAAANEKEFNQALMSAEQQGVELNEAQLLKIQEKLDKEKYAKDFAKAEELKSQGKHDKAMEVLQKIRNKKDMEATKAKTDFEKLSQKEQEANFRSTLSTIATLSRSGNKTLFYIGQAAALASAYVNGSLAVTRALASAPPPYNFALAGLVGTAVGVQIATIAGQTLGFAQGGEVTGGIPGKDSVPIVAQRGEIIAPSKNYDELIESVARSRGFTDDNETGGVSEIVLTLKDDLINFIEAEVIEKRALGVSTI